MTALDRAEALGLTGSFALAYLFAALEAKVDLALVKLDRDVPSTT